jgi:hypothetical protein
MKRKFKPSVSAVFNCEEVRKGLVALQPTNPLHKVRTALRMIGANDILAARARGATWRQIRELLEKWGVNISIPMLKALLREMAPGFQDVGSRVRRKKAKQLSGSRLTPMEARTSNTVCRFGA